MSGINKVILIGRLGKDPELKYTPNGKAVTNFSIATSEVWTDNQGERQEKTEWHRIVLWGKTAENAAKLLAKGKQVYIEGRLQTRKWQDRDGNDRYTTEVVGSIFQLLESLGQNRNDEGYNGDQDYNGQDPSEIDDFDSIPF